MTLSGHLYSQLAARRVRAQGMVRHLLVASTRLANVRLRVPAAACDSELFTTVRIHFRHVALAQHWLPNETAARCEVQLKQKNVAWPLCGRFLSVRLYLCNVQLLCRAKCALTSCRVWTHARSQSSGQSPGAESKQASERIASGILCQAAQTHTSQRPRWQQLLSQRPQR